MYYFSYVEYHSLTHISALNSFASASTSTVLPLSDYYYYWVYPTLPKQHQPIKSADDSALRPHHRCATRSSAPSSCTAPLALTSCSCRCALRCCSVTILPSNDPPSPRPRRQGATSSSSASASSTFPCRWIWIRSRIPLRIPVGRPAPA